MTATAAIAEWEQRFAPGAGSCSRAFRNFSATGERLDERIKMGNRVVAMRNVMVETIFQSQSMASRHGSSLQ
jgi:hypothetical protein